MLVLAVIVGWLLHRSLFGFRLLAIGGNPVAARLARLPVTRYKIIAFVLSGALAAIAGILDFSFIQTVQPNSGLQFTFPVFAAVIIGGASLPAARAPSSAPWAGAPPRREQQGLAPLTPGRTSSSPRRRHDRRGRPRPRLTTSASAAKHERRHALARYRQAARAMAARSRERHRSRYPSREAFAWLLNGAGKSAGVHHRRRG
jgi:hypothetical protein